MPQFAERFTQGVFERRAGAGAAFENFLGFRDVALTLLARTHAAQQVGDVVEAIIGAIYLDSGLERAEAFIRANWTPFLEDQRKAPVHPKSALQEIAAEKKLGVPAYEILARVGPHHAPRFRVRVSLGRHGEAEAEGASKQEAETAAAAALLEKMS